jgi:biotin carboxyl carrier protein
MTQTYSVQLGAPFSPASSRTVTVTVVALGDGRYQVTVGDGPPEVLSARKLFSGPAPKAAEPARAAATWSLLAAEGGPQHLCDIEGTAPDLKVSVSSGELVALKLLDQRAQALLTVQAAQKTTGPADVRAPMPGKVVKVLCQPGQKVQAGQGLLIIEAMKMENELRAPTGGVVRHLAAVEGQTVEGGAVVVSIGLPSEE